MVLLFSFPHIGVAQNEHYFEAVGDFSDDVIAVKKDGKWGFINAKKEMVVAFRKDITISNYANDVLTSSPIFKDNRCLVMEYKNGIPYYGFINKKGEKIIETKFLNATNFYNGYALAIYAEKVVKGQNEYLKKDIISYHFSEVIIDTDGNIIKYLKDIPHILMSEKRFKKPFSDSRFLNNSLITFKNEKENWQIVSIN